MVTFAELRSARPQGYRRAAQAWLAFVAAVERQAGEVAASGSNLAGGWTGSAGGAAVQHLAAISHALTDRAARAGAVPGILTNHAREIDAAQATVERVLAAAAGTPIRVDRGGRVSLSPLVALQPVLLPLWLRLANELQELIDRTVVAASAVDEATARRLWAAMPPHAVGIHQYGRQRLLHVGELSGDRRHAVKMHVEESALPWDVIRHVLPFRAASAVRPPQTLGAQIALQFRARPVAEVRRPQPRNPAIYDRAP